MSNDHVGNWHTVDVTQDDADCLDYDLIHVTACELNKENFSYAEYLCDMQNWVDFGAFDDFGIVKPGLYRARLHTVEMQGNPYSGGPEWDSYIEVERIDVDRAEYN